MIEAADDWAVFMDPDTFGEPVSYEGTGQTAQTITAIFTAANANVGSAGPGFSTTEPVLTFFAGQLAFDPAEGDRVTLTVAHTGFEAGTVFAVTDPQPDGTGLIRAILERA